MASDDNSSNSSLKFEHEPTSVDPTRWHWKCQDCNLINNQRILCQACENKSPVDIRDGIIAECQKILKMHNQSHIMRYINDIKYASDLNNLILQIFSIDFDFMSKLYKTAMKEQKQLETSDEKRSDKMEPFPHKDASDGTSVDRQKLNDLGMRAIVQGKCCVVLLCGGQGTRLGSKKPKGCYNIGLPSNKSIYQLQLEKVLAVKRAASKWCRVKDETKVHIKIYLMTSEATHNATLSFLNVNAYFKYDYYDIKLFKQDLFPCLEKETGNFIMKSASEIAMSPNGNGGIYSSIKNTGILDDILKSGIEYVQVFGIDNVLARIADPLWFGHVIANNADTSNKTCLKKEPLEKVGVMCLRNGKPAVTEYTELTKDMRELKQEKNDNLAYCYGNLAMHMFTTSFLEKICNDTSNEFPLPIHVAHKKIPCYDSKARRTVVPDEPNGIKLEFFVFDTFQYSKKMTVFNILREEEFAPVKNKTGKDSPKTARLAHSCYWKSQFIRNGAKFTNNDGDEDKCLCEVSPLFGYIPDGKDFTNEVQGNVYRLPRYFVCD